MAWSATKRDALHRALERRCPDEVALRQWLLEQDMVALIQWLAAESPADPILDVVQHIASRGIASADWLRAAIGTEADFPGLYRALGFTSAEAVLLPPSSLEPEEVPRPLAHAGVGEE